MRYILIILLFISFTTSAQVFQSGKFHLLIDNATTNTTPSAINELQRYDIRTGTVEGQGNLLLSVIDKQFFYFNAAPTISNITQIGVTGAWNISIPTTITATKSIFIPHVWAAIVFNSNNFNVVLGSLFFPIEIRANNNTLKCRIFEDGSIYWPLQSNYTTAAISTTGLVQYTVQ